MHKYRKKPVVIEAIQYTTETCREIHQWIGIPHDDDVSCDVGILIHTLEGVMQASIGDYIIKGVQGEFYPCKPNIFERTYEKVTDDR